MRDTGSGWNAQQVAMGQKMEHLVSTPLVSFSDLTGKSGTLTRQNTTKFHMAYSKRTVNFLAFIAKPSQDVRNQVSQGRMEQVQRNQSPHINSRYSSAVICSEYCTTCSSG